MTASITEDMGKLVRDLAARRALITLAEELAEKAQTAPLVQAADELIEATESSLAALASRGMQTRQLSLVEALTDAINVVTAAYKRDSSMIGLSTGLAALDGMLGGLVPSELIVLAGRPRMGKSALAANIASHTAMNGTAVGFFTVEMSAQQIALRLLGELSAISSHRLRQGATPPSSTASSTVRRS
jgi:replicative DNA helicase